MNLAGAADDLVGQRREAIDFAVRSRGKPRIAAADQHHIRARLAVCQKIGARPARLIGLLQRRQAQLPERRGRGVKLGVRSRNVSPFRIDRDHFLALRIGHHNAPAGSGASLGQNGADLLLQAIRCQRGAGQSGAGDDYERECGEQVSHRASLNTNSAPCHHHGDTGPMVKPQSCCTPAR